MIYATYLKITGEPLSTDAETASTTTDKIMAIIEKGEYIWEQQLTILKIYLHNYGSNAITCMKIVENYLKYWSN